MRDHRAALPDRLFGMKIVYRDILNTSRSTFYRMLDSGEFPPGVRVRGHICWPESQITDWLKSRPVVDLRKQAAKAVGDRNEAA